MFTIDFTKPFLYKDIIYFNQGNLAANNILRCKLVTGGDETLEGYIATVTFKTLSHAEINGTVNIVDAKNCIVDIKFPSNALEVGVNELEVILTKGDGVDKVVTPSPIIKYEVWQCITTGNGIQGDSNYPILIDLISEVNNAVRIANNASATADVSLKQTVKMLDVVNDNIAKANEAIDNTNSVKDKALNAVEEVNAAKNSMIEDVNSTKNTVLADVNVAKNDMKITVDEAIKFLKQEYNSLTAQQQEELEMLQARDGEVNLNARLERDLAKGKIIYETVEGNFITVNDTLDSYMQNIEIKGNTIQNPNNLADIKSVGDKIEGQELYKIPILCCGKNLNSSKNERGGLGWGNGELYDTNDRYRSADFIKVSPNMEIVTSIEENCGIFEYDKNKKFIKSKQGNYPIVTTSNTRYIKYITSYDKNIQIQEGTEISEYEPYQEYKLNILSPVQLEKVGDIEDRIIEKDGVWGVEKNNIPSIVPPSAWKLHPNQIEGYLSVWTDTYSLNNATEIQFSDCNKFAICKGFKVDNHTVVSDEMVTIHQASSVKWVFARVSTSKAKNLEEFKLLIGNGLEIIYNVAKPQFIPLPNSQQVKLKTFANKTNISLLTEIEGTIKADVSKSMGATVNSNTQEISDLWDFVLKNNLANFTVALNALDTKLKLEQLTKTPR